MTGLIEKVRENVESAREEIALAALKAGRQPDAAVIMAVTKTHPAEYITAALECGIIHIGENRISEGGRKIRLIGKESAVFHAIGVLHRKEVRQAVRDFHWLDAVDRLEIVEEVARRGNSPRILMEVNTSGERGKMGFPPEMSQLEEAAGRAIELALPLRGFLTVGPLDGEEFKLRRAFSLLREIRDSLETRLGVRFPELSMGMSDDFTLAVLEGSTMVRLGQRLFGFRNI
jgi:pyridoxal phosphate enzyme (YggS family)